MRLANCFQFGRRIYPAIKWLIFLSCLMAPRVQAQSSKFVLPAAEGQSSVDLSEVEQQTDASPRTQYFGQVRLEGMDYVTKLKESPDLNQSTLLSARVSVLRERPRYDLAADVAGGTFFSARHSNFFVNEFYASFKFPLPSAQMKTYVGRKKFEWSEMDSRWQLGLWQARQALDTLRPEEQGLSGVFLNYEKDNFEIMGLASPLFIPTMGPEIREEGGSLVSDSRWYRAPASEYDFNNRINSISYSLDVPQTEKLTNNYGGAIMARIGQKARGPWGVASGGYKPVNDLILKRRIFKAIAADRVDVTVSPEVTHHTLASADVGYSFETARITASYLQDRPDVKTPEQDWAVQKLLPLQAYSLSLDFNLDNIFHRSLAFQLSYLRIDGGGIEDIASDGKVDEITLFDQRQPFTNASAIQVEGQLARLFNRPLLTRFRYLYDYDQRGSLLMTEFLYYPSQKWALIAGADVLGVEDESNRPSGFLNQYRANDRFYGGMTYVF